MRLHAVRVLGLALVTAGLLTSCGSDGAPGTPVETTAQAVVTRPQPPALPTGANEFQLRGDRFQITYAASAEAGRSLFIYRGERETLVYSGNEIQTVQSDLGTLVSVALRQTVDSGSTTLSLLLPRVEVQVGAQVPVETGAITTVHRFSYLAASNLGQLDQYSFEPLQGTAAHMDFEGRPPVVPVASR